VPDCPLVDPGIIGQIIEEYFKDERMDYVSNVYPQRMFPRGLDVELFTFKALEEANKMDFFKTTREHVTSYIKNTSKFNVLNVTHPQDYSSLRWTVDTVEDYKLLKLIYEELARKGIDSKHVDWIRIVRLMMKNPSWFRINNRVRQKNTY
jgi:spore coat polysaccharide biosynthesis protein SpsF